MSVTNVGVAAHIAGARPGSARYDATMSTRDRTAIQNAIWLCQTHAKAIDDDQVRWTVGRLEQAKAEHEENMLQAIGVARKRAAVSTAKRQAENVAQEYAYLRVRDMLPAYRAILQPMLDDQHLGDDDLMGVLMTALPVVRTPDGSRQPWTVFVRPDWLNGAIAGKPRLGPDGSIPDKAIIGRVPGWPDEFMEFLQAIVQTGTTFRWQRTAQGHLALGQ